MRQPFQVLVYPARIAGDDWEYLLLRRVPSRGGFWQGITGGVEEGEDLAGTAMRELAEEAGLVPSALEQMDCSYSLLMQDEWRELYAAGVEEIVEYVFVAFIDRQQEPAISWEHDAWQWCSLDEALELLTYPENKEALKSCARFVQTRASAK
jgi:dATP pyrophosphohydrolase